jgi:hypothetical protein
VKSGWHRSSICSRRRRGPRGVATSWRGDVKTILPLIWQPSLQPVQTVPFGTGPTTISAFLSRKNLANGWLWGVFEATRAVYN